MQISTRPKGNGKFRVIYMPNHAEKKRLRALLPRLNEIHSAAVDAAGTRGAAHGFVANRNPVTCALPHRGFQVTVSCDLESWFDTVTDQHLLTAGVPPDVVDAITIPDEHGVRRCRQGLPTSPVAANIAAVAMDRFILETLTATFAFGSQRFAYTRYADDLTVSFDSGLSADTVVRFLAAAAQAQGWTIAEHKTHIQRATAGRRVVVGIAVDDRVQATRKTRRKLRAARHQCLSRDMAVSRPAIQSATGIAEWAACKLPRACRSTRRIMGALAGSGPVTASTGQTPTVAISGSGRRVLVPVREKIADESANK